ncbi:hypothetical protein DNTS_021862 [Danionella cerebrum]|uniref:Uncharacterized protein n=1 Tax=Danionella cerebrum TaxID=2873325 RepID=A0A553MZG7_9TELE|nr:hypothetical protein DNTS_021862 [Danionella translucida]
MYCNLTVTFLTQGGSRGGRRGICAFFRRARKIFRRSGEPVPAPQAEADPVPGPSGLQGSVNAVADPAPNTAVPEDEASRGDQESLFLLLKQKLSLSQDHLGSRVQ